jgi:MYXO-CTERM domain-containing protein
MNPPEPPPTVWTSVLDLGDGTSKVTIGQKVGIFPPAVTTSCACGIGLGSTGSPAPGGVMPMGVRIVIAGPDDAIVGDVPEFLPLVLNGQTGSGLAGGPGANPGATWFGFNGLINPFVPPALPPTFMYKMLFDFVVPNPLLGALTGLPVQFAGGEADPDGFPQFTGPHATGYFSPLDPTLPIIPAPGAAALGLAALVGLRRRR